MDTLELTDSFLQEAQAVMGCDPDIPMHYRILCKLNQENELDTAKRFLEANRALFQGRYAYLVLQSAVEMCLNLVADENGTVYRDSQTLPKEHIYRPAPAETECIAYLSGTVPTRACPNSLTSMNILRIWNRIARISAASGLISRRSEHCLTSIADASAASAVQDQNNDRTRYES